MERARPPGIMACERRIFDIPSGDRLIEREEPKPKPLTKPGR